MPCVVQQVHALLLTEYMIAKVAQDATGLLVVLEEQQEQLAVICVVPTFHVILLQESMTARVAQDALVAKAARLLLLVLAVNAV